MASTVPLARKEHETTGGELLNHSSFVAAKVAGAALVAQENSNKLDREDAKKRRAAAKEQQEEEKQAKAEKKLKEKRDAVRAAVKPVLEKLGSMETATEEEALTKLSVPELKAYIQYLSGLRTFKSGEKKSDLVAIALPFWGEEPQILESSSSEEEDDGASSGGTRKAQRNKNTPATRRARGKSDSRAWDPAEAFLEPDSPSDDEGDEDADEAGFHADKLREQDEEEVAAVVKNIQEGWKGRRRGRRNGRLGTEDLVEGNRRQKGRLGLDQSDDEEVEDGQDQREAREPQAGREAAPARGQAGA